jgi:predicted Zn-dependent peptidase
MMARTPLLALLVGATLLAQGLPDRPEKIPFKPMTFGSPRTEGFKAKLENGIPVYITADATGVPFVRLSVHFRGGSYLDPKGKEGLAALAGWELRAGGTAKLGADALDERVEFLAGSIRSQIGATSGEVAMDFMEKDLQEGLDLFMQVLTQPAFSQDRLDQAKAALFQQLKGRNDQVPALAEAELARLLNGEDHFSAAAPTEASLKAISREDLQAFQARLIHPENLVVSVSGRFQREAMLALLNRTLGRLQPGGAPLPKPLPPSYQRQPGIYVVAKEVPQSMVCLALPGLRRTDPDWHAAVVMNQILGGSGFTSRMMKKIRSDEGLTYGIGTGLGEGIHWKGDWRCQFQTKNRSVAYALRLALAEIERIKREPVPEEELNVIKDALIQAFPGQWGSQARIAASFAIEDLCGWPENWWFDYREKIQAVTIADVQRVAQKYLTANNLVVLVVGNAAEAEAGDSKDHPGLLREVAPLPLIHLPLRDPLTLKPIV